MNDSVKKTIDDSSEKCLHLINRIFNIMGPNPKETEAFRKVSHEDACEAFRYWLEQMRIILPEPVNIAITQSLRDDGVDVLLEFQNSKVKFGFQIKSSTDVKSKDFTKSTIAQIERSRKHDIYRLFLVICADTTDNHQKEKVRGLTSEISEMGEYCIVFSPEKAFRICKVFQEKEHPISQVEGMEQVIALLGALQKKLSEDPHYAPEISLTYKLKDRLTQAQRPIRVNLTVKYARDKANKTFWDLMKEIQPTGKSVTIPRENIEKFEVFMEGKRIVPEGTKPEFLTITPEKPKLPPLVLEVTDPEDSTTIGFENIIFERDAIEGTTVHMSTHENNMPYVFRMSLDKDQKVGSFGFSVEENADVGQLLKFERLIYALNKGQELVFKTSDGKPVFGGKAKTELKPLDEEWVMLLRDLAYIQQKTATCIYLPKSLENKDLYEIQHICQLLRKGKTEVDSLKFKIRFTKDEAKTFLKEIKEKKLIKDVKLGGDQIQQTLRTTDFVRSRRLLHTRAYDCRGNSSNRARSRKTKGQRNNRNRSQKLFYLHCHHHFRY